MTPLPGGWKRDAQRTHVELSRESNPRFLGPIVAGGAVLQTQALVLYSHTSQPVLLSTWVNNLALGSFIGYCPSKAANICRPTGRQTEQNTFMERETQSLSLRPAGCDSAGRKSSWHVSLIGNLFSSGQCSRFWPDGSAGTRVPMFRLISASTDRRKSRLIASPPVDDVANFPRAA